MLEISAAMHSLCKASLLVTLIVTSVSAATISPRGWHDKGPYPQVHGEGPFPHHGPCRMQFCDYTDKELWGLDNDQWHYGPAWHKIREAIKHCVPMPVDGKTPDRLFHRDYNGQVDCAEGYGYVGEAVACKEKCIYYSGGDWDLFGVSKNPDFVHKPGASGLCSVLKTVIPKGTSPFHYNDHCPHDYIQKPKNMRRKISKE